MVGAWCARGQREAGLNAAAEPFLGTLLIAACCCCCCTPGRHGISWSAISCQVRGRGVGGCVRGGDWL